MSKGVGIRPKLSAPNGRLLERTYRPMVTCIAVSSCITVLVSIVFGLTAYNIYEHRFQRTEHKYHAGDEVSLSDASWDLSAMFCSAYQVHPFGWTDFYMLPHKAQIDSSRNSNVTFTLTTHVNHRHYVEKVHYLTTNTSVSLTACHNIMAAGTAEHHHDSALATEFLVIVGDNNFQKWHKFSNNRHAKYRVTIPDNATCDPMTLTSVPSLNFTVPSSNDYHFILVVHSHDPRSHNNTGNITLTANLNKTHFNLTDAFKVCNSSQTSCLFPLSWGSRPDVVANIRQSNDESDKPVSFSTRCELRLPFWISVFGVAPFVVIVFVCVGCWCLLVKKQDIRSHYRRLEQKPRSRNTYGSMEEKDGRGTEAFVESPSGEGVIPENDGRCVSIQD